MTHHFLIVNNASVVLLVFCVICEPTIFAGINFNFFELRDVKPAYSTRLDLKGKTKTGLHGLPMCFFFCGCVALLKPSNYSSLFQECLTENSHFWKIWSEGFKKLFSAEAYFPWDSSCLSGKWSYHSGEQHKFSCSKMEKAGSNEVYTWCTRLDVSPKLCSDISGFLHKVPTNCIQNNITLVRMLWLSGRE